ncbi:acyl-CoA dehydrogenase family protein [Rhizobium cremeum]|uniref:acyl-CoA dehydrogenase family protein n=1 Tax=Rhizobium cremeum TaxID=2813827 RepID=UPI000DDE2F48|nr:acyl-CoA dehydrogenase family protein [Rhizobium cremeum]MCJ7993800.1 acyl-CoA dehydrogenase family protein [Rhizobium cremeum]MCJ7998857.1 acyl-CoA dehydrogenase family protein [Rhizobium cremeum]
MDFTLSDQQQAFVDMATEFADDELAPFSLEWDQKKHFPIDTLKKAGSLGLGAICVADDVGGSGLGRLDTALIIEALATGCPTVAAYISIHNMCATMIDRYGTPEQREEHLPALATMDALASYCLTEPGCGSDAAALKTRAVRDGDDYVLTGQKQFISGAGASALYIVMARTGEEGPKGISAFLVPGNAKGLTFGANEKKMGWNAQPTRAVMLDGVRVPESQRLGAEGEGFRIAMSGLDGGRLNIAAASLGGARAAFKKATAYVQERKAFGQPLADFQSLQFTLADMAIDLEAARTFLWRAATALDDKASDATVLCAMAKRLVTDRCFAVANQALQLHGGYGYLAEYGVEKIVRDLRVHQILEGTNEIMRVIVARSILGR